MSILTYSNCPIGPNPVDVLQKCFQADAGFLKR